METSPITSSLESLVKKGIPQNGTACAAVPGSDVEVCVYRDLDTDNPSNTPVVQTIVKGSDGHTISQQRFDIVSNEKRAQVETHIYTDPEDEGKGMGSGLIRATNAVIYQMIRDFPDVFQGRNVQGVIRDEATHAYRRSIDTVGQRTSWSSRRAKELGYRSLDDERGPIWIKPYSHKSGSGIGNILKKFLHH